MLDLIARLATSPATSTVVTDAVKEQPLPLVLIIGIGIVFIGLISIILICKLMSMVTLLLTKSESTENSNQVAAPASAPAASNAVVENKQELIAAISAVVAEELGTDISAIRIISFKKL